MVKISDIISKLKVNMEIPMEFAFLQKYNKHKNSIFEKDEIEEIKDALIKSASLDEDKEDLSWEEMIHFYNNSYEHGKQADRIGDVSMTVQGWINGLLGVTDEKLAKLQETEEFKNASQLQQEFILFMAKNSLKFHDSDLYEDENGNLQPEKYIQEYSEEELKQIFPLLKKLSQIPTLNLRDINRNYINGILKENLENLYKISQERINYIVENDLYNYEVYELIPLLLMEDSKFETSLKYLNLPKLSNKISISSIQKIIEIPNAYERINEMLSLGYDDFDATSVSILNLSENEYNDFKEFKKKSVKMQNGISKKLDNTHFFAFKEYSSDVQNRALNLFYIEGRNSNKPLRLHEILNIAKSEHPDIYNFIKEHPDFEYVESTEQLNTIELIIPNENTSYIFDVKDGLIETDKMYPEQKMLEVNNKRNHIRQEIYFDDYVYIANVKNELDNIKKEVTYYCDANNVLQRVTTAVKSEIRGLPNVSVIYSNGKTKPLQFVSHDNNSGNIYTEKHFVSPSGLKTDYYYEETPDGTRIIDYRIKGKTKDKNKKKKKISFHRNLTHQKISENKYLSSINGHPYEVEFNDLIINITDKKSGKQEVVDLTNKIAPKDKELFINILKYMPANQLLMMNYIPIKRLEYNDKQEDNAFWYGQDIKKIEMLKLTHNSTTELESLRNVFMHEYGHYLDSHIEEDKGGHYLSEDNARLNEVFDIELNKFIHNSTYIQQKYLAHLLEDSKSEKLAEDNFHMNAHEPYNPLRGLYFPMNFPASMVIMTEDIDNRINSYLK